MLLAAGFSVASHSWISTALLAVYLAVFYPVVIRREQMELETLYGDAFLEYASRVPGVLATAFSCDAVNGELFLGALPTRIVNTKRPSGWL